MTVGIREATINDTSTLLSLIRALARYEKLEHEVVADEATLRDSLFGNHRVAYALLAECNGVAVGFCLYFYNFSTFLGRPGIYLEDLYVEEPYRHQGIGRAFMQAIAQKAVSEKCGRMEWWVLNWNQPAIDVYRRLGAVAMDEWTVFRLTGSAMHECAKGPK